MRSSKSAVNKEKLEDPLQEDNTQGEGEDLNEKENNARNLGREQNNRQKTVIGLYDKCPICNTAITNPDIVDQFQGQKFYLLQFAANNDNTGYETYRCDFCNRYFCHVISDTQIMITPQFTVSPLSSGMGGGNPFAGNGNGRADGQAGSCGVGFG